MLNNSLIKPKSIAVIGASNNLNKPGGRLVMNLLEGGFKGAIYPVNPKEAQIQDLNCYAILENLPDTDLAILALPAALCVKTIEEMESTNVTKAFIIISAGFAETGAKGRVFEKQLGTLAKEKHLSIIGPNCIGVLNTNYQAFFVSPLPKVVERGVDFVSASGAFAVFVFELAALQGLKFGSVYSVGNSVTIGVEEVLNFWDESYEPGISGRVKLVYAEQIKNPRLFFKHIHNLRKKGCQIVVLKPGDSEAGARAALSHTGALAGDREAYDLLIHKAGAIRCSSREEMVYLASILSQRELKGNRIVIISHAGGPAVMLSDELHRSGFEIPEIDTESQKTLLEKLHPGSSANNPIDILATANREQLAFTLKFCAQLKYIDGIIVIYGRTGLEDLFQTYALLNETIKNSKKPVYAVLPSVSSGCVEIAHFIDMGHAVYPDEVVLAKCLGKVCYVPSIYGPEIYIPGSGKENSEKIILSEEEVRERLKSSNISYAKTQFSRTEDELNDLEEINFPVAVKVMGILHKTEQNGVMLNVKDKKELGLAFKKLITIQGAKGVLVQEMMKGTELYVGGKMHEGIGWSVHAGLGGIFIELLNDRVSSLAPLSLSEAEQMLTQLKAQQIFEGFRNLPPVNRKAFAHLLVTFSKLFLRYPDIAEIDLNPLISNGDRMTMVDARIIVEVSDT